MTVESADYRRGEMVRILDCPLNQQHRGMTGELIEVNGRVVCVDLGDGTRCWTSRVEPIDGSVTVASE